MYFHEKLDGKNVYLIADPHIGHKNIVYGESNWSDKTGCRSFDTTSQMNDEIIKSCRNTLNNDSILVILGDVLFGDKSKLYYWLEQIPSREIHLIYGNHCDFIRKDKSLQGLFDSCNDYLEVFLRGRLGCYHLTCLFHYPIRTWRDKYKGSFCFSGHVHGVNPYPVNERALDLDWNIWRRPMNFFELEDILGKKTYTKLVN